MDLNTYIRLQRDNNTFILKQQQKLSSEIVNTLFKSQLEYTEAHTRMIRETQFQNNHTNHEYQKVILKHAENLSKTAIHQASAIENLVNTTNMTQKMKAYKILEYVKSVSPPIFPRDANVMVFLRTSFEDHVFDHFTTRQEIIFALSIAFSSDPSRSRLARQIADQHLPADPNTETLRLPTYHIISKEINESRAPGLVPDSKIQPLKSSESIRCFWRRLAIVVEDHHHDLGVPKTL